jgi:hypothetical protein
MQLLSRRRTVAYAAALALSLIAVGGASTRGNAANSAALDSAADSANASEDLVFGDDSLGGASSKLYVSRIPLIPFSAKRGAILGSYHIGFWPGETQSVARAYANPVGFIEVTPENETLRISEHFRLRDFLTHDQARVWPKYLVLREELVDKLELVIEELEADGHRVKHMTVMSGFRTPQYNATGGNTAGRAELSHHMYGDASDVFVDNNADGRMDDLNGDHRVDHRDAQVIVAAAERVEAAHPALAGGGGVYKATSAHGPFAHIDVRGRRARWGPALMRSGGLLK